jgi:hypothetical protein
MFRTPHCLDNRLQMAVRSALSADCALLTRNIIFQLLVLISISGWWIARRTRGGRTAHSLERATFRLNQNCRLPLFSKHNQMLSVCAILISSYLLMACSKNFNTPLLKGVTSVPGTEAVAADNTLVENVSKWWRYCFLGCDTVWSGKCRHIPQDSVITMRTSDS